MKRKIKDPTRTIKARIGPIIIRGDGTYISKAVEKTLHTENQLENFLHVDINDAEVIDKYCEQYGYLPKDTSIGWTEGFRNDYSKISNLATKMAKGTIDESDMETILEECADVRIREVVVTKQELINYNKKLYRGNVWHEDSIEDIVDGYALMQVREHSNIRLAIWDTFITMLKQKIPLRKCARYLHCRRFFVPSKYTPKQKYCCTECRDNI